MARPNAVMIIAPPIEMTNIQDLAKKLDQPVDPTTTIEVFSLKHAIATQAAATLTNAFQAQAAAGGAAGAVEAHPQSAERGLAECRVRTSHAGHRRCADQFADRAGPPE